MLNIIRSGDFDFISVAIYALSALTVIFLILPVHEFAHALTADLLGDRTAYYQGRKTLNPLRHIDYFGALLLILFGFGWARPVPVNSRNFKNPKAGMAITALAGPLSNLIMGFIAAIFAQLFYAFYYFSLETTVYYYIFYFFQFVSQINVMLAVFNLIPVPPLDGSRIITAFLPDRIYYRLMQYERYTFIILAVLLFSGVITRPLTYLSEAVLTLFYTAAGKIVALFI